LTPNLIPRALSLIRQKRVRALVMGGQACVLYGAAEFSRDLDLALSLAPDNLERFRDLLSGLGAHSIALPPFEPRHLEAGHAAHFRCAAPEVAGLRIDVMSVLRGLPGFEVLWGRRTSIEADTGLRVELLSLPDLVRAKKTQRDKDWPMIRRLVEAHYFLNRGQPSEGQMRFWLLESRTPEVLIEVARQHPSLAASLARERSLLTAALEADLSLLPSLLLEEEMAERSRDREYWKPLRREIERLRRKRTARRRTS